MHSLVNIEEINLVVNMMRIGGKMLKNLELQENHKKKSKNNITYLGGVAKADAGGVISFRNRLTCLESCCKDVLLCKCLSSSSTWECLKL